MQLPQSAFFRFVPLSRTRIALAALVFLVFGVSISLLTADVLRQIENESESRSDNAQWALSQIEVELTHLVVAVDAARDGAGTLAEARLRFDVFYSRLKTLRDGSVFVGLREKAKYTESFGRLTKFMESLVPIMDGPDDDLRECLPKIYMDSKRMIADARVIALAGLEVIAAFSDRNRKEVVRTLTFTGLLTAVLVASLATLVILLLQLYRYNRQRAAENLVTLSRLDAIVATALEAIVTVDERGHIVDFNDAACQTLGYDPAEAVGADIADLIAPLDDGQVLFKPGTAPDFHGRGRVRVNARHKNGTVFPAEMSISRTGEGDETLYVAFLRDLSVQLAAERTLTTARDDALAGEKAKADLLVVMSHEIRTPLNGMIGTIELLETTELQPHQREYLRIMEASGQLLMHHVNDVLDIARLDSGKAQFNLKPIDLSALVLEVLENQRPASQASGNLLEFLPAVQGPDIVVCDGAQLRQVLLNLVGNAVKFTRNGRISISVAHLGLTGITEIRIADTGIGIAKADIGRIFDDFVTLDASYARHVSGTGLGLGIVRRIVDRMGGTLEVESQEGKGSTFTIRLPLTILDRSAERDVADTATQATVPMRQLVTLVVEDNEFNRVIAREMLQKEGHLVFEASDGEEGIAMAASQRFDLILMDISMPKLDGLQAALAILAGGGASSRTPIVAMTAHALAEETERFRKGGMQRILTKPITREAIRTVLASLPVKAPDGPGQVVDLVVLRSLSQDLGRDKADTLTGRFLTEAGVIIARIGESLSQSDLDPQSMRDLHRLEGSAAMFGAVALHQTLQSIETAWKQGQTRQAVSWSSTLATVWQDTATAYQAEGFRAQPSSLR